MQGDHEMVAFCLRRRVVKCDPDNSFYLRQEPQRIFLLSRAANESSPPSPPLLSFRDSICGDLRVSRHRREIVAARKPPYHPPESQAIVTATSGARHTCFSSPPLSHKHDWRRHNRRPRARPNKSRGHFVTDPLQQRDYIQTIALTTDRLVFQFLFLTICV